METFITILIILAIMIICYYINRFIFKKEDKTESWNWGDVKLNLIISIIIPFSIVFWIIYIIYKIPSLPKHPPKWL